MPKTKDAFAFRTLSNKLKKEVGSYNLPDSRDCVETSRWSYVAEWWGELKGIYNHSYDQEIKFKKSEASIEYLLMIDRQFSRNLKKIERHLSRLRKIFLVLSKENSCSPIKLGRVHFLLAQYEWFRTFFLHFSDSAYCDVKFYEKYLPDEYNVFFASRLKEARTSKKMKQAEVAEKLKITPAAYSNYERGARDLPPYTIYRLTQILGVSADYLFGLEN